MFSFHFRKCHCTTRSFLRVTSHTQEAKKMPYPNRMVEMRLQPEVQRETCSQKSRLTVYNPRLHTNR